MGLANVHPVIAVDGPLDSGVTTLVAGLRRELDAHILETPGSNRLRDWLRSGDDITKKSGNLYFGTGTDSGFDPDDVFSTCRKTAKKTQTNPVVVGRYTPSALAAEYDDANPCDETVWRLALVMTRLFHPGPSAEIRLYSSEEDAAARAAADGRPGQYDTPGIAERRRIMTRFLRHHHALANEWATVFHVDTSEIGGPAQVLAYVCERLRDSGILVPHPSWRRVDPKPTLFAVVMATSAGLRKQWARLCQFLGFAAGA